jgi:hypothetical protein
LRGFIELRVRAINEAPTKKPKGGTGEFKIDMQRQKKKRVNGLQLLRVESANKLRQKHRG